MPDLHLRLTSAFLRAKRLDDTQAARLEHVLAAGRAFITTAGLAAIYFDATEPARFAGLAYAVLCVYVVFSFAILAWLHRGASLRARHTYLLHAVDIVFASLLNFLSDGPGSPLFLYFLFVVAASAYRWGFVATLVSTAITLAVFLLEIVVASAGPWNSPWFDNSWPLNRTILRLAYLLLIAFLVGYLAEQERESRTELAAIAELPRQPRFDLGLRGSVAAIAEKLSDTFAADAIAIVLREHGRRSAQLWWHQPGQSTRAMRHELLSAQAADWLFADPGRTWHAILSGTERDAVFRTTEPGQWTLARSREPLPELITRRIATRTVTAVNVGLGGEWQGRLYLYNVRIDGRVERAVHFLAAVGDHVTPVLTNVFLLRRLRHQETTAARARVARELHDGVIQALFGIDMKLEALRRRPSLDQPVEEELATIQHTVRDEVAALRELMNALKPIELDSSESLPDVLVNVVERFRRDSGVSARFMMNGDPPSLRPRAALEVVRIVQEALVNVRRHSRARNVLVRLTRQADGHQLVVEDDGCGFGFEGSLTGAELDAGRLGPTIIKERARVLAATLAVHSTPGQGSRIELTFGEGHA